MAVLPQEAVLDKCTPAWNGSLSDLTLMRGGRGEMNCTWLLRVAMIMRTD